MRPDELGMALGFGCDPGTGSAGPGAASTSIAIAFPPLGAPASAPPAVEVLAIVNDHPAVMPTEGRDMPLGREIGDTPGAMGAAERGRLPFCSLGTTSVVRPCPRRALD